MASKLFPFRALRTLSRLLHSRPTSRYTPLTPLASRQSPLPFKALSNTRFSTSSSSSEPQPEAQTQTDVPVLSTHKRKHKPHAPPSRSIRPPQPEYEMTFTCKPCGTRSSHRVSKQGYHFGSVLITCPECKNRHVISDHLNIFGDKHMTIEDLMREQGQLVKKGTLSEDGDLEFWSDGSTTKRGEGAGVGVGANESVEGEGEVLPEEKSNPGSV